MSLFSRDFDNDPFFSGTGFPQPTFPQDPFLDMFGGPRRHASLTGGEASRRTGQMGVGHPGQQVMLRDPFQSMMFPFGGMSPFGSMFQNMERMMQAAANDPNAHTFSSSSVMHYSSSGAEGGQPKVYHATSSTRQAPGGIKETRKSVHDSESGTRKLAIGHHLGDRSHVIEKQHNLKTQEREEHHEFVNIDEEDAGRFNREWTDKTTAFNSRYQPSLQGGRRHEAQAMQRGLPSVSDNRRSHAGEKRKHRPPSLNHDDDDVQIVDHHHPTKVGGASVPKTRPKVASHEKREFGDRQLHTGNEESFRGFDQGSQRHRAQNFQASGHHASTSRATVGHSQLHQQSYNPEMYSHSGGHSRQYGMAVGEQMYVSGEQHRRESRNHTLDDHGHGTNIHEHDVRSNKRQKRGRNVAFK